jgi:predicted transcriptional regulator
MRTRFRNAPAIEFVDADFQGLSDARWLARQFARQPPSTESNDPLAVESLRVTNQRESEGPENVPTDELRSVGDDKPFELRLAEAIAWCSDRANPNEPANSLRSDQLRPWMLEIDRATTVRHVLESRASTDRLVRAASPVGGHSDLASGRLLLYFPDANLADGAAEAETGGFFDVDNVPPWDTWVGLFRDETADASFASHLVSWVPGTFVASVDRGIHVNPEECIAWLEEARVPLAKTLRSRGLLS